MSNINQFQEHPRCTPFSMANCNKNGKIEPYLCVKEKQKEQNPMALQKSPISQLKITHEHLPVLRAHRVVPPSVWPNGITETYVCVKEGPKEKSLISLQKSPMSLQKSPISQ